MIALQYWLYFCHISTRIAMCVLLAQSCPTLCDPVDCSRPGSSVRGTLQARRLEWVAIAFSLDPSDQGIKPGPPALQVDSLPSEPPGTGAI